VNKDAESPTREGHRRPTSVGERSDTEVALRTPAKVQVPHFDVVISQVGHASEVPFGGRGDVNLDPPGAIAQDVALAGFTAKLVAQEIRFAGCARTPLHGVSVLNCLNALP
jgi:hypothetical protein